MFECDLPYYFAGLPLLHSRAITSEELETASAASFPQDSNSRVRQILRSTDARSASPGESWQRLRLIDAGFGRPDLQIRVDGAGRTYRLDLGCPDRPVDGKRLGLEYDIDQRHSTTKQQFRDETCRTELDALGWHVISVRRPDLWGSLPRPGTSRRRLTLPTPRLPRRW